MGALLPHLKQLQLGQLVRAGAALLAYGGNPSKPWAGMWFVSLQVGGGVALECVPWVAWCTRIKMRSVLAYGGSPSKPWAGMWFVSLQVGGGRVYSEMCVMGCMVHSHQAALCVGVGIAGFG
jgi:hypothetical protein